MPLRLKQNKTVQPMFLPPIHRKKNKETSPSRLILSEERFERRWRILGLRLVLLLLA